MPIREKWEDNEIVVVVGYLESWGCPGWKKYVGTVGSIMPNFKSDQKAIAAGCIGTNVFYPGTTSIYAKVK